MNKDTIELSNPFSGYINVRWNNVWNLKNEAVDRPIMYNDEVVGFIISVDADYIIGKVFVAWFQSLVRKVILQQGLK